MMLSASAPHTAAVSTTITPDHFEEIIWSRWQIGEYWHKFSIALLPSPFEGIDVTTALPPQYL